MSTTQTKIDPRSQVAEERYGTGAEILLRMNRNHDLPLPNKRRVATVMQEYFKREGYADELRGRWRPSITYWHDHLDDVRRVLRDDGRPFEYIPDKDNPCIGQWKFPKEKEEERRLNQRYNNIRTLTDSFNEERDGVMDKWSKLPIPTIAEVPLLDSVSRFN